jgi:hypothetical protein
MKNSNYIVFAQTDLSSLLINSFIFKQTRLGLTPAASYPVTRISSVNILDEGLWTLK